MTRKSTKERTFGPTDALLAGGFAALAAFLCFSCVADFAFPGESAALLATVSGCAGTPVAGHPVLRFFARHLGGNLLAPVAGAFAVAAVYALVAFFVCRCARDPENEAKTAVGRVAARLAGAVAAALTLFSPAFMTGATHLEANLFGVAWLLLALLPFPLWHRLRFRGADALFAPLIGALWGAALVETPVAWWFAPFAAWGVWVSARRRTAPFAVLGFALAALAVYALLAALCGAGAVATALAMQRAAIAFRHESRWLLLALFATAPFVFMFFALQRALARPDGWMMWTFHLGLSACLVLALAVVPLSPAGVSGLASGPSLPVATSLFAAVAAGGVTAYWWVLARTAPRGRVLGIVALTATLPLWALAALVNFVDFDPSRGDFADKIADCALDELGDRAYLVPGGPLADNLRLAARRRGLPTTFLDLRRDGDRRYAEELAKGVDDPDLRLSLDLGVYAFSKELMRHHAALVATVGRPGLWSLADVKPVPGFALFGGEKSGEVDFAARWRAVKGVLAVHGGWGSREIAAEPDAVERLRLDARRHFGMMANERAAWLQDRGRDDEACALYALAFDEIDADNLSALFNLLEMAQSGPAKARARKAELEGRAKAIVNDKTRRYRLGPVLDYYGRLRGYRAPSAPDDDVSAAAEVARAMEQLRARKLVEARKTLDDATRDHPKDLHAWSLLAAVVMQQCDEAVDEKEKQVFDRELACVIVPAMEKAAGGADFYVQTVRAFLLLREGEARRREARDAFAAAVRAKPDASSTQNALLGMDISLNDPVAAEAHARDMLRRDRTMPLANYVMGSLALRRGDLARAVEYLHRAADATNGTALAANDLAETLRRLKRYDEAERYARQATREAPKLYVAWDTLGSVLLDRGGDLNEAADCIAKACALSAVGGRPEDIRMLASLARVQLRQGDRARARMTLGKMRPRLGELSAYERGEYDRLLQEAR